MAGSRQALCWPGEAATREGSACGGNKASFVLAKALDKCVGALVRRTSPIENQTQVMAAAAAEHIEFGLNNAEELLEWFVENGFLSSRRFKGIRDVMALAQQERQRKEVE